MRAPVRLFECCFELFEMAHVTEKVKLRSFVA